MTHEQEKKARLSLRIIKKNNILYYCMAILLFYIIANSKEIKWLSFDDTFNIIVNSCMLALIFIELFINFIWQPSMNNIFLFSRYQSEVEQEKKKRKLAIAKRKLEKTKEEAQSIEEDLKQYH